MLAYYAGEAIMAKIVKKIVFGCPIFSSMFD
jgi:hypothetical protein